LPPCQEPRPPQCAGGTIFLRALLLMFALAIQALVIGCAETPQRLLPQSHGVADDPRNPPLALRTHSPALPEVSAGNVGSGGLAGEGPAPVPDTVRLLRLELDGKPAEYDAKIGQWEVKGTVSASPKFVYTLAPEAGELISLVVVMYEVREGKGDADNGLRLNALGDLPPGKPFPLNHPGHGVRIRTADGQSVEQVTFTAGTTYLAWVQVQTTGRRDGKPWPWPQMRFTIAPVGP